MNKELIDKQTCLEAFDEIAEILLQNGYTSLPVKVLKTQYEILRDFYDARKEQTPQKPTSFQDDEVNYHCPACDHIIKASNFGNAFCSFCGQRLDWSETDE